MHSIILEMYIEFFDPWFNLFRIIVLLFPTPLPFPQPRNPSSPHSLSSFHHRFIGLHQVRCPSAFFPPPLHLDVVGCLPPHVLLLASKGKKRKGVGLDPNLTINPLVEEERKSEFGFRSKSNPNPLHKEEFGFK